MILDYSILLIQSKISNQDSNVISLNLFQTRHFPQHFAIILFSKG